MPVQTATDTLIRISIPKQTLTLECNGAVVASYPVSTALNGPGQADGSGCTPLGEHYVRACIGAGQPLNTVFRGRRPTGEIYSP
ncbi:MAG: L,D-transpeptidase, partial [Marinobacter sp. 34-60-7]